MFTIEGHIYPAIAIGGEICFSYYDKEFEEREHHESL